MFIDALDVDDVIAHLLVAEGFTVPGAGRLRAGRRSWRRSKASTKRWPRNCVPAPAPILKRWIGYNEERRRANWASADELTEMDGDFARPCWSTLGEQGVQTPGRSCRSFGRRTALCFQQLAARRTQPRRPGFDERDCRNRNLKRSWSARAVRCPRTRPIAIIMAARAHWFDDEPEAAAESEPAGEAEAAETEQ